jgi:hypothetical protein
MAEDASFIIGRLAVRFQGDRSRLLASREGRKFDVIPT